MLSLFSFLIPRFSLLLFRFPFSLSSLFVLLVLFHPHSSLFVLLILFHPHSSFFVLLILFLYHFFHVYILFLHLFSLYFFSIILLLFSSLITLILLFSFLYLLEVDDSICVDKILEIPGSASSFSTDITALKESEHDDEVSKLLI